MRRNVVMVMLFLVVAFVQGAWALPSSSYYEGRSYYEEASGDGGIAGYVDFAVYDTELYPGQLGEGLEGSFDKRYIYVYQIFCDDISTIPFEYFEIDDIGEGAFTEMTDMGMDDLGPVIAPDKMYFGGDPMFTKAIWEFEGDLLIAGVNSALLLLNSDSAARAGSYSVVKTIGNPIIVGDEPGDAPVPDPDPTGPNFDEGGSGVLTDNPVPEPVTLALLAAGGVMLLRKRKQFS